MAKPNRESRGQRQALAPVISLKQALMGYRAACNQSCQKLVLIEEHASIGHRPQDPLKDGARKIHLGRRRACAPP